MQNLFESTFKIQDQLNQAGIDSAVIGALAVALWGKPRLTQDVDLKVLLSRDQSERLIKLLGKNHRFLTATPEETLKKMGFIFLKSTAGIRIDLLLADTPFDTQAIQRAKSVTISPDLKLKVVTPEDLIIYKLISTRAKDHEDVRGVLLRQKKLLEKGYILKWLRQFESALDDSTLIATFAKMQAC